ncbi:cysteine synthase [Sphingobium sp. C100]|uniref:PLP-dependent cysteine synthase family protein n=1 Tax=Sphingobium sp. C100 TaxID=1207055 RepID=UPI0003D5CB38|nr:PLP-dependent cysteine synthase family protein [Sphingobium sp. C100]ETI64966.1 cysteine synthase [Sphingobium sp. C100]
MIHAYSSSPARDCAANFNSTRTWTARAVAFLAEERRRAADTPLIRIDLPEFPGIDLYLKDESTHPSGSLKHRLAHALFLHAICNGDIDQATLIVEASSGSTAISEAWFARELGLEFVAVVPTSTALAKIEAIQAIGGEVQTAPLGEDICEHARRIACERGGHFMDQFRRAAEVTDWRGSNNIAESVFAQLRDEPHPMPDWVIVGAGTGGTSATIGRYIRLRPELAATRLCVVDPEGSAFFRAYSCSDPEATGCTSRVVEGIGRARVEPSFMPKVVDRMLSVSDVLSVAGAHWLEQRIGKRFGPSTGTNIIGALMMAEEMVRQGCEGSIVTLGCDGGERYASTIYQPCWLAEHQIPIISSTDLSNRLSARTPRDQAFHTGGS